jgi:hypothetical protein
VRALTIKENQAMLDETFFALFNRLLEAAAASNQPQTAQAMATLQEELLEGSEYGRKLKSQYGELEAAVKTLQEAGKGLTREKLLDIFLEAPTEARLQALVSMTRNGLDYSFFQVLTERIEKASGERRAMLESLREKVLDYTNQIDKAMQEQAKQADAFIEQILAAPDIQQATAQNIDQFNNETIAQVLEAKLREANQKQDKARLEKLQQMVMVLQQASTPPELELVNELLEAAGTDASLEQALKAHESELTEELTGVLASLMQQIESQGENNAQKDQILRRLEKVYRAVVKRSMQKSMKV